MAKENAPPITNVGKYLQKETFLPVYFFFGEDIFSVDSAVKLVESKVRPFLATDFDKETFQARDISVIELMDMASSFPFGSDLKLIIVKNFDEIKGDKKKFASYVKTPSISSIVVLSKEGTITNMTSEPYISMLSKNYMFEARELKGQELISWILRFAKRNDKLIQSESAEYLVGMVGENKGLLEMQLQKIIAYLGSEKEITYDVISKVATELKEYTIFDLLNAVGDRNKRKALQSSENLLEQGSDVDKQALFIISMLTKYFQSVARIPELEKESLRDEEKARLAGVHRFFYKNYKSASDWYNGKRLLEVSRAIYDADLSMKSTSINPKTIIVTLLGRILTS